VLGELPEQTRPGRDPRRSRPRPGRRRAGGDGS
jgi:hypothetical protein